MLLDKVQSACDVAQAALRPVTEKIYKLLLQFISNNS